MRYTTVFPAGPSVSILGLGCAALLGRAGRRDSLKALSAAWDAGITFYDTARSYGYGESEALLGEFFVGGLRHKAVICTKFGILPAARNWKQRGKPVAQALVRAFPSLRGIARRNAAGQLIAGEFSVELLRSSLETSLRRLRTDYVDMLLLHAAPVSVLAQNDLLGEMERLVESGKVRMAGISGEADVIAASFTQRPQPLRTAQFAMNLAHMELAEKTTAAARDGWFLVANHPFGGQDGVAEFSRKMEVIRHDASVDPVLRAKIQPDATLMPEVVLNLILRGTGVHAVIPSMMDTRHLQANLSAIEGCRFTDAELAILRGLLSGARGPLRDVDSI